MMHSQNSPSHSPSSHTPSSQSNRAASLDGDSQNGSLLSHGPAPTAGRCRRLDRLRWNLSAVMMSIAAVGAAIAPAWANPILTKWTFEPDNNFLEIILTEDIKPRYYLMARPARVVLDLPGTTLGTGKIRGEYPGAVRHVQVSQPEPELTRIVLELAPDAILAPEQVAFRLLEGNVVPNRFRWALQPLIAGRLLPPVQPGTGIAPVPAVSPSSSIPPSSIPPSSIPPSSIPSSSIPPSSTLSAPPTSSALPGSRAVSISASPPPAPPSLPIATAPVVSVQAPAVRISKEVRSPLPPAPSTASRSTSLSLATAPPVPSPVSSRPGSSSPAALSTPQPPTSPPLPRLNAVSSTGTVTANVPVAKVVPPPADPIAIADTAPAALAPQVTVPPLSPLAAPTVTPTGLSRPENPPRVPVESVIAPSVPTSPVIQVATAAITADPSALAFETVATEAPSESPTATGSPSLQANANAEQPAVTVPPLSPRPMPQATSDSLPTSPAVNSPALRPAAIAATQRPAEPSAGAVPVIEFGQPLPWGTAQPSSVLIRPSGNPGEVLLPSGTLLNLRYPGPETLNLRATPDHQEVLLLQTEVRDDRGQVLMPVDSRVMGRFETNRAGSRFIAHAIALPGRTLQLQAESEVMTGDRAVQPTQLAINSGLGAVAGGVLGKGSGAAAVGGAAAGAAVSYFTAPKPASIVPGQLLQIRLLENLR